MDVAPCVHFLGVPVVYGSKCYRLMNALVMMGCCAHSVMLADWGAEYLLQLPWLSSRVGFGTSAMVVK